MKKIKKLIVLAMATVMLFGATLTVNAACTHSPQFHSFTKSYTYSCGTHSGCTVTVTTYYECGKCPTCGALFNVQQVGDPTQFHSK